MIPSAFSHRDILKITQASQGSDAAFAALVEDYQTPVYNLCYRMLGEPEAAEDAAQESFLRAYQKIGQFDLQRSFLTWLLSIAAHYCIDSLRRRKFYFLSIEEEADDDDNPLEFADPDAIDPVRETERREEQRVVQRVLQSLNAADRAALILRYWYDLSEAEIAESLHLSAPAAKSRLHHARCAIARRLTADTQSPALSYASHAAS